MDKENNNNSKGKGNKKENKNKNIIDITTRIKSNNSSNNGNNSSSNGNKPIYLFFGKEGGEGNKIYPNIKVFFITNFLHYLNEDLKNKSINNGFNKRKINKILFDIDKINWGESKVNFIFSNNSFINSLLVMNNTGLITNITDRLSKVFLNSKITNEDISECNKFYVKCIKDLLFNNKGDEEIFDEITLNIVFIKEYGREDVNVNINMNKGEMYWNGGLYSESIKRAEKEKEKYIKRLEKDIKRVSRYNTFLYNRVKELEGDKGEGG